MTTETAMDKAKLAVSEPFEEMEEKVLFACISGSHLYGWATEKSDVDVRGFYVHPTERFFELKEPGDTIEMKLGDVDVQIWEIRKFLGHLISPNMNFIEIILAPEALNLIYDEVLMREVKSIAEGALTKKLYPHIQGMVTHMKKHDRKYNFQNPKKPLYIIRELLRGIYLFETGKFQSDIKPLANELLVGDDLLSVNDLIDRKVLDMPTTEAEIAFTKTLVSKLEAEMLRAKAFGLLPSEPKKNLEADANKLLKRIRKEHLE